MSEPPKPASKFRAFLQELKECIKVLQEVFIEVKNLLVIIALILFFTLGVYEAVSRLLSERHAPVGQTVSRPLDQAQK